jgi:hypothetical protein
LFFALCYIALTISIMVTFQTRSVTFALPGLLMLAGSISSCVMQISKERFWKRIAQRRALALHDAQSFIAASQPWPIESAQLPQTIRVKTNFKLLLYGALILLAVVTIFVVLLSLSTLKLESILIVLSSILLPCALLIILFPLIYGRIYFQSIEVTEEGVTTHYLGETQHIRWEDARLFARYDAINTQGRNPIFQTYELTDDQTVVRWNNVAINLPLMRIESNQG